MKEVKCYVSDDGKQKSTNKSDIIDYENIKAIGDRAYIGVVNDDDSTFLYKLDGEKDLYYLLKHLDIRYSKLEDNYIGYVISRYTDPDCWARELVSADQHIKEAQSRIDELNAEISTIKNYMK